MTLVSGQIVKMVSLKIGDVVEVTNKDGAQEFSKFVGWMEKEDKQTVEFYKLTSESGNELVMTGIKANVIVFVLILFLYKETMVSL